MTDLDSIQKRVKALKGYDDEFCTVRMQIYLGDVGYLLDMVETLREQTNTLMDEVIRLEINPPSEEDDLDV